MRGNDGAAQNALRCTARAFLRRALGDAGLGAFRHFPAVSRVQTMNKSRVLQMGTCSRAKEPGPAKIQVRKDFRMKGPAAPFPLLPNRFSSPLLTGCLPGKLVLQGSDAAS
jgi:hypothetical protein